MKSIYFAAVPTMRGRLTMRFTDVVAENYKPREEAKRAKKEMREAKECGEGCGEGCAEGAETGAVRAYHENVITLLHATPCSS